MPGIHVLVCVSVIVGLLSGVLALKERTTSRKIEFFEASKTWPEGTSTIVQSEIESRFVSGQYTGSSVHYRIDLGFDLDGDGAEDHSLSSRLEGRGLPDYQELLKQGITVEGRFEPGGTRVLITRPVVLP